MAIPTISGRLRFHLTVRSGNAKTGPIPVSTSSAKTCPTTCPFMGNGCYAASGPLALHWKAVTAGKRGNPWQEFLADVAALPAGQIWRHNAAGDLYRPGTVIGRTALAQLVAANRGKRGYTYSHHKRTPATVAAFKAATANGFTVNASCETVAGADHAIAQGLRAVFVVPSTETRTAWDTPDGNRAVLCPAQRIDGLTCEKCRLCQSRPQNVAVAFKAHGTGRRKVEAVLAALS
jgi:hypothetical protein